MVYVKPQLRGPFVNRTDQSVVGPFGRGLEFARSAPCFFAEHLLFSVAGVPRPLLRVLQFHYLEARSEHSVIPRVSRDHFLRVGLGPRLRARFYFVSIPGVLRLLVSGHLLRVADAPRPHVLGLRHSARSKVAGLSMPTMFNVKPLLAPPAGLSDRWPVLLPLSSTART